MSNGDYGSYNSTFQTGYNQQGNFGHQNQFNNYRGFGRGRGRRGNFGGNWRGAYEHNTYGSNADNNQDHYRHPSQQYRPTTTGLISQTARTARERRLLTLARRSTLTNSGGRKVYAGRLMSGMKALGNRRAPPQRLRRQILIALPQLTLNTLLLHRPVRMRPRSLARAGAPARPPRPILQRN